MSSPHRRVAFADIANANWTAGAQYYQNLFLALRSLDPAAQPDLALVKWRASVEARSDGYSAYVDRVLNAPAEPLPRAPNFWERQRTRVWRRLPRYHAPEPNEPILSRYLRELKVDALFASWREFGPKFRVPLLAWIHDFQNLHYPELFSAEDLRRRDEVFTKMAAHATRVILSSQAAARDFASFAPHSASKARVLPFVAQLPSGVHATDPAWVCKQYHLPQRFFYLPNQFWRHKNHVRVVEALSLLHAQHPELTVVCSGNTNEPRASFYFGELLADLARRGLRDQFMILGWIPHDHVFPLMRQAVAVLQPSLFEGWSTTVEECKSLGKPIVLSDISVHREQNPPHALFFDPNDPHALAECLRRTFEENPPGPAFELEAAAREYLPTRTRAFGETFMHILEDAVRSP